MKSYVFLKRVQIKTKHLLLLRSYKKIFLKYFYRILYKQGLVKFYKLLNTRGESLDLHVNSFRNVQSVRMVEYFQAFMNDFYRSSFNLVDLIILDSYLIKNDNLELSCWLLESIGQIKYQKSFIDSFALITVKRQFFSSNYFFNQGRLRGKLIERVYNKFFNLVQYQDIAIIGPGYISEASQKKIFTDNNIIVRLNTTSNNNLNTISDLTHIVYFNSFTLQYAMSANSLDLSDDITLVLKSYLIGVSKLKQKNYRFILTNDEFLIGAPNLLQMALYDLLHFKPNIIRLYGIDFFTSKTRYANKDYIGNKSSALKSREAKLDSMSIHNPFTNLLFVENLVLSGFVEVRDDVKELFFMSKLDYLKRVSEALDY